MKKRFCLLVLGLSALALAACGGGNQGGGDNEPDTPQTEHTHTYSSEWSSNETHHWHAATCEHTEEKSDYAEHSFVKDADETREVCSVCEYVHVLVSELAAPQNLAFANGVLTFDAVEHAKRYDVTVSKGEEAVLNKTVTETTLDLLPLEFGQYTVSVVAKAGSLSSSAATLEITQKYFVDGKRILEAEDYVINAEHISVDEDAHGGKYALGFNDCGQGLYFQYYSYKAGERAIDVHYSTAAVGSYMNMYIGRDEEHPIMVLFDENTGWFGDSKTSAVKTVTANLQQGWNDIYLFKEGTAQDYPEYGGWAQIDYIEIAGSDEVLDSSNYTVTAPARYQFEAEQAKWHWKDANARPNMSDAFPSHGYLGFQDNAGDGVTYNINMPYAGTYLLKFASAADQNGRYYDVTVNDVKDNIFVKTGPSWDHVEEDDGFLVHLNQGANTIDFSRGANGNWACIDYLAVEFVSESDPVLSEKVANLKFAEGVLSFDAVEGYKEYKVVLSQNNEVLLSKVIRETSLEVPVTIHGDVLAQVFVKKGFFVAPEAASLSINPDMVIDKDVKLEAELATIGEKHYSVDSRASGGAYALGFDQCGEGLYFRYYAFEAGEREVEICYSTGVANSKMELRANNEAPVVVTFTENTGWFGDSGVSATVKATATLSKGWNNIYLIKNGTDADNYGGWVQIDYMVVKGTLKEFDSSTLSDLVCNSYKLEAESGNWRISYSRVPQMNGDFSIAFLGDQDTEGDGVTYKFYVDQAGTYKVQFFCGGESSRKVSITVNNDKITDEGQNYYTLTTGAGWNAVAGDPGFNVSLNQGWNTIDLSRLSNELGGGWLCIDYCLVTLVA